MTMANLSLKTHEFALSSSDFVCDVFAYKAMNIEESHLGNLLIVGEAITDKNVKQKKNRDVHYPFIINQAASQIKKEYYQNPKRDAYKSLEESLKKANIFLAKTAAEKKHFNPGFMGFAIASYADQNLHFSASGKTKILLLRSDQLLDITKKLSSEERSESKTFTNIASGKLIKDDLLLIVNSNFTETFPEAILKPIIINNTFEKIYDYLSETLKNDKNKASCMIILKVIEDKNAPVVRYSYEELTKIGTDNKNKRRAESAIKKDAEENVIKENKLPLFKKIFNFPVKAYKKSVHYIKSISGNNENKRSILNSKDYLKKSFSKRFGLLGQNKIFAYCVRNKNKMILFIVITLLLVLLIYYLSVQEKTYLIK